MNILTKPTATLNQCINFTKNKKTANKLCFTLIPIIYEEAVNRNINPAIAIAQAYKETGYFNFGGVLDSSFHNVCGLKNPAGGGDKDKNAHKRFESWEVGITAYLDHLALYAGAKSYPRYSADLESYYKSKGLKYDSNKLKQNGVTEDPRHFTYLHSKCKTVESLSGNWAPAKTYGSDIVKMVKEIESASNADTSSSNNNDKAEELIKEIELKLNELKKLI